MIGKIFQFFLGIIALIVFIASSFFIGITVYADKSCKDAAITRGMTTVDGIIVCSLGKFVTSFE